MRFAELPPEEQRDFRGRLGRLDLDETALIADELVIEEGGQRVLSLTAESSLQPRILETTDLDKVRQWVGVPEGLTSPELNRPTRRLNTEILEGISAFRTGATSRISDRMTAISGISAARLGDAVRRFNEADVAAPPERLRVDELEVLRHAAYMYVNGDQALARPYKAVVEQFFGTFEIPTWLFTSVHVKKNAVLQFGKGSHNLTAHKITLEPGATIRSYGHLTVNCSIIERKKGPSVNFPHLVTTITARSPIRRFP